MTSLSPPPQIAAALEQLFSVVQHQRYVATVEVCSAMLFVYDYLLTLDLEIEHIWKAKWSLVKVIYIIQRYLPFLDSCSLVLHYQFVANPSLEYCRFAYTFTGWTFVVGIFLSDALFLLRLWAVWKKTLLSGLAIGLYFLGCWIPSFVIVNRFLKSLKFATWPGPLFGLDYDYRGCFLTGGDSIIYVGWVLMMANNIAALIMIMIPGFKAFKTGGRTGLVKTVYRDGAVFYAAVVAVSTANAVTVLTLVPDLRLLLSAPSRDLHSILASRVILSIRHAASATEMNDIDESGGQVHVLSPMGSMRPRTHPTVVVVGAPNGKYSD
ncbi:hypothetical protein PM082_012754 [Marasmius tenuissimus]|nr:hypothetical protein PM082_012754 [Marasmius tenuissimus]